jgi:hypothetical protein
MLTRLIWYEFKALMRFLPAFYLGIQVLAVAAALNTLAGPGIITRITETLWNLMYAGVFIASFAIIILRFRDNLLKDEGYLMFTLPVPPWKLIASKAAAAFCCMLLSGIALALSLFIYGIITDFTQVSDIITGLSRSFRVMDPDYSSWIPGIVLALVFVFQQLCLIYTALIASRIAPRFRGPIGFGVFLAVWIVLEQPATSAAVSFLEASPVTARQIGLILFEAAFAALYFWAACLLLKRHFNLE